MGGTSCNSTHNSTIYKPLIIRMIIGARWKGGITYNKKYFFEKMAGNVLITVKNSPKQG